MSCQSAGNSGATGALLQNRAMGSANELLNLYPTTSLFGACHEQITRHAIVYADMQATGAPSGQWNAARFDVPIQRDADLAGQFFLCFTLSALGIDPAWVPTAGLAPGETAAQASDVYWTNGVGWAIISQACMSTGSQSLVVFDHRVAFACEALSGKPGAPLHEAVGYYDTTELRRAWAARQVRVYTPLPVYTGDAASRMFPVSASSLQPLTFRFDLRSRESLICAYENGTDTPIDKQYVTGGEISDVTVLAQLVYLEKEERMMIASCPQLSHITQWQIQSGIPVAAGTQSVQAQINVNHPLDSFYFFFEETRRQTAQFCQYFAWSVDLPGRLPYQQNDSVFLPTDPIASFGLSVNGTSRIAVRDSRFFRLVVPWLQYSRIPSTCLYAYSFALDPMCPEHTGSFNASRVDNLVAHFTFEKFDDFASTGLVYPGSLCMIFKSHNFTITDGGSTSLRHAA